MQNVMIEWTIRRRNGSVIRTIWTTTEIEADHLMETAKACGKIPQTANLEFECKRVVG